MIGTDGLHLESETELRTQVLKLQFNNAHLSGVVDDKKSFFSQMEMLDLIDCQFFFTTNSLRHQLTASQFVQPLAPWTLLLVATTIHCALSESATGKTVAVMYHKMNIKVILLFHGDRLYHCRSHYSHESHIGGLLHTTSPHHALAL